MLSVLSVAFTVFRKIKIDSSDRKFDAEPNGLFGFTLSLLVTEIFFFVEILLKRVSRGEVETASLGRARVGQVGHVGSGKNVPDT